MYDVQHSCRRTKTDVYWILNVNAYKVCKSIFNLKRCCIHAVELSFHERRSLLSSRPLSLPPSLLYTLLRSTQIHKYKNKQTHFTWTTHNTQTHRCPFTQISCLLPLSSLPSLHFCWVSQQKQPAVIVVTLNKTLHFCTICTPLKISLSNISELEKKTEQLGLLSTHILEKFPKLLVFVVGSTCDLNM